MQEYLSLANQQTLDLLSAFFVEGSIALGGFNERFSDIDFVALLNRPATSADLDTLRYLHKIIEKSHPRWRLSGRYLPLSSLSRFDKIVEPVLYYHDGVLRPDRSFELNSVEGWILKNHGIALVGPEPQTLPFTLDWDLLIKKMRGNLNSYWARWTRQPDRFMVMLSDWGIQWTVLGGLRQFYSFREHTITTKTKAAEYALTQVPARWHQLIREAMNIREGKKAPAYRSRVVRTIEAVNFLKYIIQTCNAA